MTGLGNTACGNVTLSYIQTMISFTLLVYLTITMIGFMLKSPGIVFCQYIEFVIVVKHCWFSFHFIFFWSLFIACLFVSLVVSCHIGNWKEDWCLPLKNLSQEERGQPP